MSHRDNQLVVAICGAGHSGSTLLGLVLGSHSRCFYAGEAKKSLFIGDLTRPLRKRVCKLCGEGCPVWSRFTVPPDPDLYEQAARLSGRPVVVDSTKRVEWLREREAECDRAGVPHRRVYLTRDGRAVVNSRLRKTPGEPTARLVDDWLAQVTATEAFLRDRPGDVLRVRYEALATDPEATVRDVAGFLGLAFEPAMLAYETFEHHPLGGNTGTQSVVARAQTDAFPGRSSSDDLALDAAAPVARTFAEMPARSRDFYRPIRGGFRLDLRWRTELPGDVLRLFEERAGEVNRAFRWDGESV